MRIGILTYHFANNYGAALQAYCMQSILREQGVETEFIDFRSKLQISNNSLFSSPTSLGNCIKNIIRMPHYSSRKHRIDTFIEFRKERLTLTVQSFSDVKEVLEFAESKYDALVVGSDQIWNPSAPDFDEIYFNISASKIPVYAYAVSLGTAKAIELAKYKSQITKFSDISVREVASINILSELDSGICAKGVLDPTLLPNISMLEKLVEPPRCKGEAYVACYYLGRQGSTKFKKAVKALADKFGYNIYFINANYGLTSYGHGVISDCGPDEFLGFLKYARFVCTNSFHATALSIRFNVPFFDFENSRTKDTRKIDLLNRLDIPDRIVWDYNVSQINDYRMHEMDLEEKLASLRINSMNFIQNAINESSKK